MLLVKCEKIPDTNEDYWVAFPCLGEELDRDGTTWPQFDDLPTVNWHSKG